MARGDVLFGVSGTEDFVLFKGAEDVGERVVHLLAEGWIVDRTVLPPVSDGSEPRYRVSVRPVSVEAVAPVALPTPKTWIARRENRTRLIAEQERVLAVGEEFDESLALAYIELFAATVATGVPLATHRICTDTIAVCQRVMQILESQGWRAVMTPLAGERGAVHVVDPAGVHVEDDPS